MNCSNIAKHPIYLMLNKNLNAFRFFLILQNKKNFETYLEIQGLSTNINHIK